MIYEHPGKSLEVSAMEAVFQRQREAFDNAPIATAEQRIAHLKALSDALRRHQDRLGSELSAD
ncbi:hypothetical protein, partial [Amnimonas aquatica]